MKHFKIKLTNTIFYNNIQTLKETNVDLLSQSNLVCRLTPVPAQEALCSHLTTPGNTSQQAFLESANDHRADLL